MIGGILSVTEGGQWYLGVQLPKLNPGSSVSIIEGGCKSVLFGSSFYSTKPPPR